MQPSRTSVSTLVMWCAVLNIKQCLMHLHATEAAHTWQSFAIRVGAAGAIEHLVLYVGHSKHGGHGFAADGCVLVGDRKNACTEPLGTSRATFTFLVDDDRVRFVRPNDVTWTSERQEPGLQPPLLSAPRHHTAQLYCNTMPCCRVCAQYERTRRRVGWGGRTGTLLVKLNSVICL